MQIKTIVSAALLASVLGVGGVAYAQTMIGNQNVSEADMQRVQNVCDDLKTGETQAVGVDKADQGGVPSAVISSENAPTVIGNVDTDAITLENCIEAGFIER